MELLKITVEPLGPGAVTHNMPCAVCHTESAVMKCDTGIFKPCWDCQGLGHQLILKKPSKPYAERSWWQKLMIQLTNDPKRYG